MDINSNNNNLVTIFVEIYNHSDIDFLEFQSKSNLGLGLNKSPKTCGRKYFL